MAHNKTPATIKAIEIIPDRLYFTVLTSPPKHATTKSNHFFSTDRTLLHYSFFLDFGPLNLGCLYRFCAMLNDKLDDPELAGKRIIYYSSPHAHRRCNAVMNLTAYSVLFLDRTPEEAYGPFQGLYPPLPAFHDASPCADTFGVTILDTLRGLDRSRNLGFLDLHNFDLAEYEHWERVEHGDLNWIFPGKFIAFAGPHSTRSNDPMYPTSLPSDYIDFFKRNNVKLVVRLNKKYYDAKEFTRHGIAHLDLYYPDGGVPPRHLLDRFLDAAERCDGAVAVHCKAGLGRTGTCIGAYAVRCASTRRACFSAPPLTVFHPTHGATASPCPQMKHWNYTARELIGWMRVCRPGSVIGPQQQFLADLEQEMHRLGKAAREAMHAGTPQVHSLRRKSASPDASPLAVRVLSPTQTRARDLFGENEEENVLHSSSMSTSDDDEMYSVNDPANRGQGDELISRKAQATAAGVTAVVPDVSIEVEGGDSHVSKTFISPFRNVARKLYLNGKV